MVTSHSPNFLCSIFSVNNCFTSPLKRKFSRFRKNEPYLVNSAPPRRSFMTDFQIILTTCADREQAERIAHRLIELHLAACVNILPGVQSIYRWQGAVESAAEVLLL